MIRFKIFLLAVLVFISEGIFVEIFSEKLYTTPYILVPRFIVIFLVFLGVYGKRNLAIIYAFGMGIFYDVVYTEVLGVYLFALPLMAYFSTKLMKVLQINLGIVSSVCLLAISVLEIIVYEVNLLIGFTSLTFIEFAQMRLLPTLILNLIFLILFGYVFAKWMKKWTVEEDI